MGAAELVAYGLQHLTYFLAAAAILPMIVALYLGLDHRQTTEMLLRTFFLCGITSFIQAKWGHRYPIIDGPAGLWMSMLINLASTAAALGNDLASLRTDVELGMLVAGAIIILLGLSGKMKYVVKIFTPIVNGVFLMLMVLQLSKTMMRGMIGQPLGEGLIDFKSVLVFWVTVLIILYITLKCKGFIQSVATLVGVAAGWMLAFFIGVTIVPENGAASFFILPEIFAWGRPTLNPGVLLTCVIAAFLLFANVIAALTGTAAVLSEELSERQINRGITGYGLSTLLTGVLPTAGYVVFASSMGVISMTGVAARRPFYLACGFMVILGLISPVGVFFASMPPAVGYAASMMIFTMIIGQAISEFHKVEINSREKLIIGMAIVIGTGITFLSLEQFAGMPQTATYIFSNGLIVGTVLAIVLERVL
ncbi:MAG: purine/pyrimidine permease [Clostridiales Family XIII bacterium]|jgi:xanthine/uracil permease|nr:purine/pyrimidine permease [Clostridiales Family XIII bacterium]